MSHPRTSVARELALVATLAATASLVAACMLVRAGLREGGGGGEPDAGVDSGRDADADGDADGLASDADAPVDADGADADVDPCADGGCLPGSCAEILAASTNELVDGPYDIYPGGVLVPVHCDMHSEGGGWTRIASLDPSADSCPPGWVAAPSLGACEMGSRPCTGLELPAVYPAIVESYAEVRGYVHGYQGHSTDAFGGLDETIDGYYVDGVSITYGSPRRHLWTYAAGLMRTPGFQSCPCLDGDDPPAFVGDHYYCDSGNPGPDWVNMWYTTLPLWDDDAIDVACVNPGYPAWFSRDLAAPTSDPVEVRLMVDQCDDNVAIDRMEIYVR